MDKYKTGAFICEKRKEKGLTQKELAKELHVTDKAVSKWERGLSFPDITLLEKLSEILEISLYELMNGESESKIPLQAERLNTILSDTVQEACYVRKKQRRKMWRIVIAQFLVIAGIWLFYPLIRETINDCLDRWAAAHDEPYHSCRIEAKPAGVGDMENFYLYKTWAEQPHVYQYHLVGVDKEGESRELAVLEEKGMNLDTAPRLRRDEQYLYILFSGLDNEDPGIRLYAQGVEADIQGFLPRLFRYCLEDGRLEEMKLHKPSASLLIDAFTYKGETYALEGSFEGLLGGINLGFYKEDGSYLQGMGKLDMELTNNGALQTKGCLVGDTYLIAGGEGIYEIDLERKESRLVYAADLSRCVRAELQRIELQDKEFFVLLCAAAQDTDQLHTVRTCVTKALLLNEQMELLEEVTLDMGISAVEWGHDSVVISGMCQEEIRAYCLYMEKEKLQEQRIDLTDKVNNQMFTGHFEAGRMDEMEQAKVQWVYLPSKKEFRLMGIMGSETPVRFSHLQQYY